MINIKYRLFSTDSYSPILPQGNNLFECIFLKKVNRRWKEINLKEDYTLNEILDTFNNYNLFENYLGYDHGKNFNNPKEKEFKHIRIIPKIVMED